MSRKSLQHITLDVKAAPAAHSSKVPLQTAEGIEVAPSYNAGHLEDLEHLEFVAGLAPNLRGPYSTMYVRRPWTIRQYAGFSTAE